MKTWIALLCLMAPLCYACDSRSPANDRPLIDSMAPREATDPVPEPITKIDTNQSRQATNSPGTQNVRYRITGTEPFWSLTLGQPNHTFRSMEGDSLSFRYTPPQQAAARPQEWIQLFPLGDQGWALLRRARTPCSDGMSDKEYAYTATVWLNGRLLDGCGEKE